MFPLERLLQLIETVNEKFSTWRGGRALIRPVEFPWFFHFFVCAAEFHLSLY
jgi:hypothetical protein